MRWSIEASTASFAVFVVGEPAASQRGIAFLIGCNARVGCSKTFLTGTHSCRKSCSFEHAKMISVCVML